MENKLEIAPMYENRKWNYKLDDDYIKLIRYEGSDKNVIVYPLYYINNKTYKTKLVSAAMFSYCRNTSSIEFKEGIDYSEFTDMTNMFYCSERIESIILPKDFDTSKVTSMHAVFYGCGSLRSLDLTSFEISKDITHMSWMFGYCGNITSILVSDKWIIPESCNADCMFAYCACKTVSEI